MRVAECVLSICLLIVACWHTVDGDLNKIIFGPSPGGGLLHTSVEYVGCYRAAVFAHHMPNIMLRFPSEHCFSICSMEGKSHAGIQKWRFHEDGNYVCFCMKDLDDIAEDVLTQVDDEECQDCGFSETFSQNLTCGGAHTLSYYDITVSRVSDNEDVDVLLGGSVGVMLFNGSRHSQQSQVQSDGHHVNALDVHHRRGEGYGLWANQIHRFPITTEESEEDVSSTPLINTTSLTFALTVDWVHDRLFSAQSGSDARIHTVDLYDGIEDVFVPLSDLFHKSFWIYDMVVDPYRGMLFWTTDEPSIMACELDGRNVRRIISETLIDDITRLSIDLAEETLYFVGFLNDTGKLYKTDYNGPNYHAVREFEHSEILDINVFKSKMYFLADAHQNHSATLFKTSLDEDTAPAQTVLFVDKRLTHMSICDPEMQTPGRTDQCTDHGCSHHCVIVSDNATCRCPAYYVLDGTDEKTCHLVYIEPSEHRSVETVYLVAGGFFCVTFIVLAAGVLMCIFDKLWSQVHPKFARLTDNKILRQPVVYNPDQDDQNLIP